MLRLRLPWFDGDDLSPMGDDLILFTVGDDGAVTIAAGPGLPVNAWDGDRGFAGADGGLDSANPTGDDAATSAGNDPGPTSALPLADALDGLVEAHLLPPWLAASDDPPMAFPAAVGDAGDAGQSDLAPVALQGAGPANVVPEVQSLDEADIPLEVAGPTDAALFAGFEVDPAIYPFGVWFMPPTVQTDIL